MLANANYYRIQTLRTLVVAVFSVLLLAVTLNGHYNRLGPNIRPGELDETKQIVIAKVELHAGLKLTADHLSIAPRKEAPEGTFPSISEKLVGRMVVTTIAAGEPVTENRLAPVRSAGGLSSFIPDGYQAMTIRVDDVVGVSGFITPGTLADVVVVISPPQGAGQSDLVSKIVLQNIKVLASSKNLDRPKNEEEAERVGAVTLQVTPEQAEKLALASTEGRLQLVVRYSGNKTN